MTTNTEISNSHTSQIVAMATNPDIDLERIKTVLSMQVDFERREAEKAFYKAISEFRRHVKPITKSKTVDYQPRDKPRVCYKHASMDDIDKGISQALTETGLSYYFEISQNNGQLKVTCVITHELGHKKETVMFSPIQEQAGITGLKALASTQTYLERYTLTAALGLSTTEDDEALITDDSPKAFGKTAAKPSASSKDKPAKLVQVQRDMLTAILDKDTQKVSDIWSMLTDEEKQDMWLAESKGGYFSTEEKEFIRQSNTKHK